MRNWFLCINWLKLELQFNVFVIQTNRCFIKNKIRDLLCIRRFFIEIFSDYRISLIKNLFVIFTVFEIRICEIFLITSFDAYIEICSLEFEHQCRTIVFSFLIWIVASRLFDFDLNRYTIFFQRDRNFMKFEDFSFFMTWSSFFIICFHVNRHISDVEIALKCESMRKKKEKKQTWMNYITLKNEIIVESNLTITNRHKSSFSNIIRRWHFHEICFRKSFRKWR